MEIFAEVLLDTLTQIMSEAWANQNNVDKIPENTTYFVENDSN